MEGTWLDHIVEAFRRAPSRAGWRGVRGPLIVLALAAIALAWAAMHRPEPPVPVSWRWAIDGLVIVVMASLLRLEDVLDGEVPLHWWQYGAVGLAIIAVQALLELAWGPRPWGIDLRGPVSSLVFLILAGLIRRRQRRNGPANRARDQGGAP